jgi:Secretion system C-terminal sorting domain
MRFGQAMEIMDEHTVEGFKVTAVPNPTTSHFILKTQSDKVGSISITIMDVLGRVVERKDNMAANRTFELGSAYHTGVYFFEIRQGDRKRNFKLIK